MDYSPDHNHNNNNNLMVSTVSEAHPETLDFLSQSWCNFAVQALQPELQDRSSPLHVRDSPTTMGFEGNTQPGMLKVERSTKMDGGSGDYNNSAPSWKSNDLKSWIWMQQAMHPELNYNAGFKKKWFDWKMPFGNVSIKKWMKELKEKRKEDKRLQRAEVHAALSITGLATALAAIAEETSKGQLELDHEPPSPARKAALAAAAALVASQCAQVAESTGAKKDQLSSVIGSAMTGTSTSDLLTLTAAATTSLRGATTLKARAGGKNRLNGALVLPIELDHSKLDDEFEFENCRSILAKGAVLNIVSADGKYMARIVSVHLNSETKVILRIMKRNLLNVITSKKECRVLDLQAELYKDSAGDEYDTCYQIVLTTTRGTIKLDMVDDYQRYKMWATTINRMMSQSTSLTKYQLQFCKY